MVASEGSTGGHVRFICFQTWNPQRANIYAGEMIRQDYRCFLVGVSVIEGSLTSHPSVEVGRLRFLHDTPTLPNITQQIRR
jgi:hypothetical protein